MYCQVYELKQMCADIYIKQLCIDAFAKHSPSLYVFNIDISLTTTVLWSSGSGQT